MHTQHLNWDDREWRELERLRRAASAAHGPMTQREYVLWAARRAAGDR